MYRAGNAGHSSTYIGSQQLYLFFSSSTTPGFLDDLVQQPPGPALVILSGLIIEAYTCQTTLFNKLPPGSTILGSHPQHHAARQVAFLYLSRSLPIQIPQSTASTEDNQVKGKTSQTPRASFIRGTKENNNHASNHPRHIPHPVRRHHRRPNGESNSISNTNKRHAISLFTFVLRFGICFGIRFPFCFAEPFRGLFLPEGQV